MRGLLILLRLPFILIWLVSSLASVATIYSMASLHGRDRMNRAWSSMLVRLCGVKVKVIGKHHPQGSALWVANHVSWLDIFILAGIRSVMFIAKSEIRGWPVVGWLVAKVGTVFLQRGQRHSLKKVGDEMQLRFARGEVLGLFAEGTTSTGFDVLPFHSSLFDPAIRAQVDIQPVALRFYHHGQRSDFASFVGDETLVGNLWTLLGATGVSVEVEFLPVLTAQQCQEMGRARVCQQVQQAIAAAVRLAPAPESATAAHATGTADTALDDAVCDDTVTVNRL